MANVVAPFGFLPLRHKNGAPYSGAARMYYVSAASNPTNPLYIGDPVVVTGVSNTTAYYGRFPYTLPVVGPITAGTGNAVTGSIVGFFAEQAASPVYLPAATARGVFVADDPDLVFTCMDNGATTVSDITASNANIDITTYTGSAGNPVSGATLNLTGTTTTSTLQLKVLALHQHPKNAYAINAIWEVMFNNVTQMSGTTGF
jgi:hypothetical protein